MDTPKAKFARFTLGRIVATPSAIEALERNNTSALPYIERHSRGDWGEALPEEDKQTNEAALKHGMRILSAYRLPDDTTIWIITEAADEDDHRPATTVLLPEDY